MRFHLNPNVYIIKKTMEISTGYIELEDIIKGDLMEVYFDVEHDLDLTGMSLYAEMINDPAKHNNREPRLKFSEEDGSISKILTGEGLMEIRLFKYAEAMDLIPPDKYLFSIVMGTAPDFNDKQTIIRGKITVVIEITNRPTE